MKSIKQVFGGDIRQFAMVFALIALLIIFQITSGGRMLTSSNIQNLITGNAYVLILSIGMVMVIVIGHIDLSVGSVAGLVGMIVALSARDFGFPWWLAIIAGLVLGALIGAWQGFWLAKVGIPGFITTLAGMMIFRGLVVWVSGSISVPVPDELRTLGAGYLPEWGPSTGMNNSTLLLGIIAIGAYGWMEYRKHQRLATLSDDKPSLAPAIIRFVLIGVVLGYITFLFGTGNYGTSFPIPGLILVALVIFYHILTQRTTFGRHIYAVGGNKTAAALSGVNVSRTYFFVMANMSFLAALAGILFVGRATSAGPTDGTNWELDAIAAVFIGGAAVSGGIGTVVGSMVGGLVMAVLNSGLMLNGVGADKTQVIKGLVLLAAVAFDVYSKRQGKPSITGMLFKKKKDEIDGLLQPDGSIKPLDPAVAATLAASKTSAAKGPTKASKGAGPADPDTSRAPGSDPMASPDTSPEE